MHHRIPLPLKRGIRRIWKSEGGRFGWAVGMSVRRPFDLAVDGARVSAGVARISCKNRRAGIENTLLQIQNVCNHQYGVIFNKMK